MNSFANKLASCRCVLGAKCARLLIPHRCPSLVQGRGWGEGRLVVRIINNEVYAFIYIAIKKQRAYVTAQTLGRQCSYTGTVRWGIDSVPVGLWLLVAVPVLVHVCAKPGRLCSVTWCALFKTPNNVELGRPHMDGRSTNMNQHVISSIFLVIHMHIWFALVQHALVSRRHARMLLVRILTGQIASLWKFEDVGGACLLAITPFCISQGVSNPILARNHNTCGGSNNLPKRVRRDGALASVHAEQPTSSFTCTKNIFLTGGGVRLCDGMADVVQIQDMHAISRLALVQYC